MMRYYSKRKVPVSSTGRLKVRKHCELINMCLKCPTIVLKIYEITSCKVIQSMPFLRIDMFFQRITLKSLTLMFCMAKLEKKKYQLQVIVHSVTIKELSVVRYLHLLVS